MYLSDEANATITEAVPVPRYLQDHYWWAYLHPKSDRVWDQNWMVNLILWGHYNILRDAALATLDLRKPTRCLQIACAYGDITTRWVERLQASSVHAHTLDVVDVVPKQITRMLAKLQQPDACRTHLMNAERLHFDDGSFDHAVMFFLLHEQPELVRRNTLREALRVLRPGGRLTVVDFARPKPWHPIWLWLPVLGHIEPFAWDLWRHPVTHWLPTDMPLAEVQTQRFFGGWFQCVTITRADHIIAV